MKFTAIFIALAIACTMAVKVKSQTKLQLESGFKQVSGNWGEVANAFVELQTATGSPVGDLFQAFQDFYRDIGFKTEIEQFDFDVKEAEHNEWEAAIRTRIAEAEQDIAVATHMLDFVLYPRKAMLEEAIARDEQLIVDTNAAMDQATAEREANSAAHAQWIAEARAGVSALADCLVLLEEFSTGEPSLIQVTKAKKAFKKVHATLKNTKYGTLIKALIKLAEKEVNPEMLAKLVAKFNEVSASLTSGIETTLGEEADQQAAWEAFMAWSAQVIVDAQVRIDQNTAALAECEQEIADTLAFRAQREADLAVAEEDLVNELARWAREVELFTKLMGELAAEMQAISDVLDVFVSLDISADTYDVLNQ